MISRTERMARMLKKTILVIDDEVDFVKLIKLRLESNGYEVESAFDGEEGLSKIAQKKPDVILLDVMMPKKDGYTMLHELKSKEDLNSIPVIIITAKAYMKDLFGIEGVADYIVKPFDDDDLLLRIKRALAAKDAS